MMLAQTGPWKFVIVHMINWFILQLRIPHNWHEIRLIVAKTLREFYYIYQGKGTFAKQFVTFIAFIAFVDK